MKNLFTAGLLASSFVLLGTSAAQAQSATLGAPAASEAPAKGIDPARTRRQQQMTPEEAARDQQLQILEARTGNTSFGAANGGAYRQYDKRNGGFTVRKFKAMPGQENKRGLGHQAPGSITKGQPLVHNHGRKKKFLFF
ncbi:hypothetical protein FNT36_21740 [Hymenobacter setariae]|uniref:Uncharacterized protein n=1 Tax=Hymenobacter setariae TaxID=2594794 RepID=A0A558BMQ6_9BACT|nr:hypothetical protein [Hymenobacter setariae]TVT37794.1 hypothetical protein FNT36_21740 [Hymenobacter setariae]